MAIHRTGMRASKCPERPWYGACTTSSHNDALPHFSGGLGLFPRACAAAEDEPAAGATEDALVGGCGPDRLIAKAPAEKRAIL